MPTMPPDVLVVYVTCADLAEARRIGRALVAEQLAACVNLRPHEAIYRWNGAVETAEEIGLLAKTTAPLWPTLRDRVKALHSYDVPCVVAWRLAEGAGAYLDWVAGSVG